MNKVTEKLIKEIFDITALLQKKYPEIYANLTEDPIKISYKTKAIKDADYQMHLDSLKSRLKELKRCE